MFVERLSGCVLVATIFLKSLHSVGCMFLLLTGGNERETFVFVPSRIAEVIGLKGTLKWTQGEEFLLCLLLSAGVALFAKHGISWGMRKKTKHFFFSYQSPLNVPISFLTRFMLINVVSHLFFNFLEWQIILVDTFPLSY